MAEVRGQSSFLSFLRSAELFHMHSSKPTVISVLAQSPPTEATLKPQLWENWGLCLSMLARS